MPRMAVCTRSMGYREFIEWEIQTWGRGTLSSSSFGRELNLTKLGAVIFLGDTSRVDTDPVLQVIDGSILVFCCSVNTK